VASEAIKSAPAGRTASAARFRLAAFAPLLVLLLLCAIIATISPNFLTFNNFVRIT
jgi:ribose transport system permease protein